MIWKILSLSGWQKIPKLVESLSEKHTLEEKSRDILLVPWKDQRSEHPITKKAL